MKNRKKNNATSPNLIESERKGGALSTIILLEIKFDPEKSHSSFLRVSGESAPSDSTAYTCELSFVKKDIIF